MSELSTLPRPEPRRDRPPAAPEATPTAVDFHYTQSDTFVALLHQLGAALLVSTYQANKLLVVRAAGAGDVNHRRSGGANQVIVKLFAEHFAANRRILVVGGSQGTEGAIASFRAGHVEQLVIGVNQSDRNLQGGRRAAGDRQVDLAGIGSARSETGGTDGCCQ